MVNWQADFFREIANVWKIRTGQVDSRNRSTQISFRRRLIANARRIVVKFGTSVLMDEAGGIDAPRFNSFVDSTAKLKQENREVILVTSGAIGLGAARLGIRQTPDSLPVKQACAAVGQGRLMSLYSDAFDHLGITAAQVLLVEEDLSNRLRYLNLRNTVTKLLELGAIPVINENDTLSTAELETDSYRKVNFGDNDKLSALVAGKIEADLLLILTNVDGLYARDTRDKNSETSLQTIPFVEKITPEIEKLAGVRSAWKSKLGRGGIKSKLEAALIAMQSGCAVLFANGKLPGILERVFAGENLGTFFMPQRGLKGKRRWIAFATTVKAALIINEGAKRAILEKQASLLPAGVVHVRGDFGRGDVVSILDEQEHEFARGIVNYSSEEAKKISGLHSRKINELIENPHFNALVKRENIALLGKEYA